MNADIVVYLEHDGKRLHGEMANLASKASVLATAMDGRAVGALVGEIGDALRDEARGLNCHEVVVVHHPELREYHSQLLWCRSAIGYRSDDAPRRSFSPFLYRH